MKTIPQIDKAFKLFESVIDDAIKSNNPDDILIKSYFSILKLLKKYAGTGRNALKFSEFFYVRYVKKYLETYLENLSFTEEDVGRNSKRFVAQYKGKKVILSSDISMKNAGIKGRPDIFVGIEKEDGIIHPLAIFEVKMHQSVSSINLLLRRFSKMRDNIVDKFSGMTDESLPYFVWLYLRYEKYENQDFETQIAQFTSVSHNLAVINELTGWYESTIRGSINSILQKIVGKIENF